MKKLIQKTFIFLLCGSLLALPRPVTALAPASGVSFSGRIHPKLSELARMEFSSSFWRGKTLTAIGIHLVKEGEIEKALITLEKAEGVLAVIEGDAEQAEVNADLATGYALLGLQHRAESFINAALYNVLSMDHWTWDKRSEAIATLVANLAKEKKFELALKVIRRIDKDLEGIHDPVSRAKGNSGLAREMILNGQVKEGKKLFRSEVARVKNLKASESSSKAFVEIIANMGEAGLIEQAVFVSGFIPEDHRNLRYKAVLNLIPHVNSLEEASSLGSQIPPYELFWQAKLSLQLARLYLKLKEPARAELELEKVPGITKRLEQHHGYWGEFNRLELLAESAEIYAGLGLTEKGKKAIQQAEILASALGTMSPLQGKAKAEVLAAILKTGDLETPIIEVHNLYNSGIKSDLIMKMMPELLNQNRQRLAFSLISGIGEPYHRSKGFYKWVEQLIEKKSFRQFSGEELSALFMWWDFNFGKDEQFSEFARQFNSNNPTRSAAILAARTRAERIEFMSGGHARTNFAAFAKALVSQNSELDLNPAPLPYPTTRTVPEEVIPTLTTVDLKSKGYRYHSVLGRTVIYFHPKKKTFLALKIRRQDEKLSWLWRESVMMDYFYRHKYFFGLKGVYPKAFPISKKRVVRVKALPTAVLRDLEEQKTKSGEPIELHRDKKKEDAYTVMAYEVESEEYFKYLSDPDLTEEKFQESLSLNLHDLFILAQHGFIHTSLIELFHNIEEGAREDGGKYLWMVELVRPDGPNFGAGRLHGWAKAVRYPNFRLSGIADFAEIEHVDELVKGGNVFSKHMDNNLLRFPVELRKKFTQMSFMGDIFLSAVLTLAKRERQLNRWNWQNEASLEPVALQLKNLFLQAYEFYLSGYPAEEGNIMRLAETVDWQRMARQMAFFMASDNPYAPYLIMGAGNARKGVPESIYGEGVETDYIMDYSFVNNWQNHKGIWGFFSEDGTPDLGPFNGPLPLTELVRALYLFSSFMVQDHSRPRQLKEELEWEVAGFKKMLLKLEQDVSFQTAI